MRSTLRHRRKYGGEKILRHILGTYKKMLVIFYYRNLFSNLRRKYTLSVYRNAIHYILALFNLSENRPTFGYINQKKPTPPFHKA